jgi:hypothetical protein
MVQHTLLLKNVAKPLLQVELAKILGDDNKIVSVSLRNKSGKKGVIQYALVVVESKSNDIQKVISLIDKKPVNGKELKVTAAKKPLERTSYVNRVARLKAVEKFTNVWPAPNYKNISQSNPLKNHNFPTVFIQGKKLAIEQPKTIKKKVPAPSRALYLSKFPKTVTRKQLLEVFKEPKVRHTLLTKNKKKLSHGFLIYKTADDRKKAEESLKENKVVIGDSTIQVHPARKFAYQISQVSNEKAKAKTLKAKDPKELTVNQIARRKFRAYRINLQNHKRRLVRQAAQKKINEHKLAVAQGKAKPKAVRKLKPKKAITKKPAKTPKKADKKAAKPTPKNAKATKVAPAAAPAVSTA